MAKIYLTGLLILAFVSLMVSAKVARIPNVFYSCDATNPVTALRLCTKTTFVPYTTFGIPGAPAITQTTYYTTAVRTWPCPTLTIYSAN